jgi:hypothetical protein
MCIVVYFISGRIEFRQFTENKPRGLLLNISGSPTMFPVSCVHPWLNYYLHYIKHLHVHYCSVNRHYMDITHNGFYDHKYIQGQGMTYFNLHVYIEKFDLLV